MPARLATDFMKGFFPSRAFPETGQWQFGLSGGRSSAMLLKLALEHFGGKLPDNYKLVFNNTGREHPKTLEFIDRLQHAWKLDVVWLEYTGMRPDQRSADYKIVSYETASRKGEPFSALLAVKYNYMPRRVSRICTTYLKVYPSRAYLTEGLGWQDPGIIYGYREDEKKRLNNALLRCSRDPHAPRPVAPLIPAGITKPDVLAFWDQYDFNLEIPGHLGNCIFCFMKGEEKLLKAVRDAPPGEAYWWVEEERLATERRRLNPPKGSSPDTMPPVTMLRGGYAALLERARLHGIEIAPELSDDDDAQDMECGCTD